MSRWPSTKSGRVLAALKRIGWTEKRRKGSHRTLSRPGWADYLWTFHDGVEIGSGVLSVIGKQTGLTPEDV